MKTHKDMLQALIEGKSLETIDAPTREVFLGSDGYIKANMRICIQDLVPEHYRVRPETIDINGFHVPKPETRALPIGDNYYTPNLIHGVMAMTYLDCAVDLRALAKGLIHLTPDAAQLHLDALLSFTRSETND